MLERLQRGEQQCGCFIQSSHDQHHAFLRTICAIYKLRYGGASLNHSRLALCWSRRWPLFCVDGAWLLVSCPVGGTTVKCKVQWNIENIDYIK
jgi:hypothetical protein